ncbi:hypothetical protein [Pseudoalteromonas mariniglutinosa]|uniref:hypothetical protein n=1 Tax=Pseudoalteromonas mariniglutinosa TaxID=206042 RepID=UPI0038513685
MKKQLIPFVALLSMAGATYANEVNLPALQACTFVENDFNRLLCYDNVMAGKALTKPTTKQVIESAPNKTANPMAVTAPKRPSEQIVKNKNDDFGLEHKDVAKENDDHIIAVVKSVKEAPYGELIIALENGQQWRQVGSDSLRLKSKDSVVIQRGMFNSFLLKVEGQSRSIRVKRTD